MSRSQFVTLVLVLLSVGWVLDHLLLASLNRDLRGQVIQAVKERDEERKVKEGYQQWVGDLELKLRRAERALKQLGSPSRPEDSN